MTSPVALTRKPAPSSCTLPSSSGAQSRSWQHSIGYQEWASAEVHVSTIAAAIGSALLMSSPVCYGSGIALAPLRAQIGGTESGIGTETKSAAMEMPNGSVATPSDHPKKPRPAFCFVLVLRSAI